MHRMTLPWLVLNLVGAALAGQTLSGQSGSRSSHTVFSHELPHLNGGRLKSEIVEVEYGPGAASPLHSHPCPVIGYVLEGAVRMQVDGQLENMYRAGESFYEAPNGIHRVSANASTTQPAKFLAFFVCDNDAPLSSPVPGGKQ